jgi:hypothetical protein
MEEGVIELNFKNVTRQSLWKMLQDLRHRLEARKGLAEDKNSLRAYKSLFIRSPSSGS